MNYSFHPEARIELSNAIEYYEKCEAGLGVDFYTEILSSIEKIIDFPEAWTVMGDDIRRCLLNRFPYGILYSVEPQKIYIIAVMNLHREPQYWRQRL